MLKCNLLTNRFIILINRPFTTLEREREKKIANKSFCKSFFYFYIAKKLMFKNIDFSSSVTEKCFANLKLWHFPINLRSNFFISLSTFVCLTVSLYWSNVRQIWSTKQCRNYIYDRQSFVEGFGRQISVENIELWPTKHRRQH